MVVSGCGPRGSGFPGALAGIVLLWSLTRSRALGPAPHEPVFEPGRWAMPTDALLDLPGHELIADLPEIGRSELESPSSRSRTPRTGDPL